MLNFLKIDTPNITKENTILSNEQMTLKALDSLLVEAQEVPDSDFIGTSLG